MTRTFRYARLLVGVISLLSLPPAQAEVQRLPQQPVRMTIARHTFWLETASTPEEFTRGLMFRTTLPDKQGMLFPFMPPRAVSFWMKNTKIPLDMIFFKDQKIVHIEHNAQPCQTEPCPIYPSTAVVDAVVEVPGLTARKLHLRVGQSVRFSPSLEALEMPEHPRPLSAKP